MPYERFDTDHNPAWFGEDWDEFLIFGTGHVHLRFPPHRRAEYMPEFRAAWEARADEILETWFEDPAHYGKRPFGWWLAGNTTGEQRRCVNQHVCDGREPLYLVYRPIGCEEVLWADSVPVPEWEPERDFLSRHGLLTAAELQRGDT